MSDLLPADIRAMVREVVRDVVGDLKSTNPAPVGGKPAAVAAVPARPAPATFAEQIGASPSGPRATAGRKRTETVRLTDDAELGAFVRTLLALFENPKSRADLRAGRLEFRLAGGGTTGAGSVTRVDKGAVTERQIVAVAETRGRLLLAPGAVLTPLAREKARALGVEIEKERR
ncbi:hypothetical protein ERC79_12100 [Rhodococcus sp. ABRD24]|uniref:hypothetical protein n=1 Tax=Rhodococcus sp. ABRD24 TaxID=2507582 RepID=UPI00103C3549|nr:hypothetical protein [Rhodococcus sp. ABRD24]QBJ96627.1 hypothetical protein ERC79_12100 [Rhodococcus sp. ABRD24]